MSPKLYEEAGCDHKKESRREASSVSLDEMGIVSLHKEIDEESYYEVMEKIFVMNHVKTKFSHITMMINSGGGEVVDAFGMIDMMDLSHKPVHTFGIGICASAALMVLMAGEKGERRCSQRTQFLSHQYSQWTFGLKYCDLVSRRKFQDHLYNAIVRHYSQHTNLKDEKSIRKYLLKDADAWFTPEEMLEYGIVDEITKDIKSLPGIIFPGFYDQTKKSPKRRG